MSEWKETTLSDICSDISYGYTASANVYTVGPKFLRITDIVPDRINWNAVPYCEADELNIKKYKLQEGDIVIARTGATTGYNKIIKNIGFDVVFASYLIRYKIDVNMAYPYYIGHILQSSNWYNYVDAIAGGSAQPGANAKQLGSFEILLPPLPEQRAIASVLSSPDDKIDLLHRQNKTLEAMAETLFRQWFVEEADEGWGEGTLGDYINVKHGYAFKGKFITTEKNNQILVTPGNFKIGGGFKFGKMKYFIGSDYPKDYIFSSNDLIVTMTDLSKDGDTLGYSALIPEHNQDEVLYLHNQRVGRVEFKKYISKYLFYYLMKTDDYQWFILGGASGTSVRHTSPTSIGSYPFQVPPMKRIKEFDAVVSGLISKVHQNQIQIHTLEKLRDTLLPKVMSGEVRVEFKKHMEEYESDSHV